MNKDKRFYDPRDTDRDGLIDSQEKPLDYTEKTFREIVLEEIKKSRRDNFFKNVAAAAKTIIQIIVNRMSILKWLKSRLKEPSTYKAISTVGGVAGIAVSPELAQEIALTVAAIISLIMFVEKEREDSDE